MDLKAIQAALLFGGQSGPGKTFHHGYMYEACYC